LSTFLRALLSSRHVLRFLPVDIQTEKGYPDI